MSATGEAARAALQAGVRRLGADDGATLLEMLVVMSLLTLATGIVFPNLRRPYETLAAETARSAVVADLRTARAQAIRADRPVAFEIAPDGRTYGWGERRVRLPGAARLAASTGSILFSAGGASNDANLAVIQRNGRRYGFAVDGSTGLVRLDRAP